MTRNRGQKKPSLSDLSRRLPSEQEWAGFYEEIKSQSDRGTALVMGSLADAGLRLALQCSMIEMSSNEMLHIFDGPQAPLGNFSGRIRVGRALGIYGPILHDRLDRIRNIRNQFAHALLPLDFSELLIVKECEPLPLMMLPKWPLPNDWSETRIRYVSACFDAVDFLVGWSLLHGGKEMRVPDTGLNLPPKVQHSALLGKSAQ